MKGRRSLADGCLFMLLRSTAHLRATLRTLRLPIFVVPALFFMLILPLMLMNFTSARNQVGFQKESMAIAPDVIDTRETSEYFGYHRTHLKEEDKDSKQAFYFKDKIVVNRTSPYSSAPKEYTSERKGLVLRIARTSKDNENSEVSNSRHIKVRQRHLIETLRTEENVKEMFENSLDTNAFLSDKLLQRRNKITSTDFNKVSETTFKETNSSEMEWKEAFKRKAVGADKTVLLDLAKTFDRVIKVEKNLTYFMYSGTLLGSYRHHDVIPWDDDVDLIADISDRVAIIAALENLYPKYRVFEAGPRLKFFSPLSTKKGRYPWNWPYVDVHFYRSNSTHIWDSAPEFNSYIYPRSLIFPPHPRPLGGLRLNAPRDSLACLRLTYRTSLPFCASLTYSHELERDVPSKRIRIPCRMLRDLYPFVYRERVEENKGVGVRETVMIGETRLNSHVIDEPSGVITDPFTLEVLKSENVT